TELKRAQSETIKKNLLFDDNLKRAGHRAGGANGFTISTPVAIFSLDNHHLPVFHDDGAAGADGDAKTALITFFLINFGHFNQLRMPPYDSNLVDSAVVVCDLCLNRNPPRYPPGIFYP